MDKLIINKLIFEDLLHHLGYYRCPTCSIVKGASVFHKGGIGCINFSKYKQDEKIINLHPL